MRPRMTWTLEDHLCRDCSGRILRCASGGGATPGGNPIYRCADCAKTVSDVFPSALCWCGTSNKFNHSTTPYRCVSFAALKDRPELRAAFGACGFNPDRGGEVGVVLERDLFALGEKK